MLKLAELQPEMKEILKKVNIDNPTSGEFQAYSFRVLNAIDVLINLLDDADAADAAIEWPAKRFGEVAFIKKEYFKTFGEILVGALPKILDDFDAFSWKSCFKYVGQRLTSQLHE